MSPSNSWLTTEELCTQLAISRSTLFAIKRSGLLKPGRHRVPKISGGPALRSAPRHRYRALAATRIASG